MKPSPPVLKSAARALVALRPRSALESAAHAGLAVTTAASAALLIACWGGSSAVKPPGSALWLAADSGELTAADQSRLAGLGLTEVFLEAARLEWPGDPALRRLPLPPVPRRTASTLVIQGPWEPGEREPLAVAEKLHSEILALRIEAEQSGLLAVGFHFDVAPGERGEHFAKTLSVVRRRLGGKAFLSVGFERDRLDGEHATAIAAGVDFVTSFLYGQIPGEAEDPGAWDLQAVEGTFRKLEALRKPYYTGAITIGAAYLLDRKRNVRATTTRLSLGELVNSRQLELKPGFTLEGIDRQLFEFVAKSPTTIGEWRLERGDSVRVVKSATPLVEEFRRRVGAWESPQRLGELYYRLPRPEERLSLSARNLATVLGPDSAEPVIELALEREMTARDRWILRARIDNRGDESSDLAFYDSNYVEVEVDGAVVVDAEPGEFRRADLFHDGERGTMQALRAANQARLYLPLLEGGKSAQSGAIQLRLTQPRPQVRVSASFLLPDGHLLATDPIEWSFDAK